MADIDWKKKLTPEQYKILIEKGTEVPFSGDLLFNNKQGDYTCAACGNVVFKSDVKYDSDTPGLIGWPSFSEAVDADSIKLVDDDRIGMHRTEVLCSVCGGHLGHLFDDPASPTGQHYCINSTSLDFKAKETKN